MFVCQNSTLQLASVVGQEVYNSLQNLVHTDDVIWILDSYGVAIYYSYVYTYSYICMCNLYIYDYSMVLEYLVK